VSDSTAVLADYMALAEAAAVTLTTDAPLRPEPTPRLTRHAILYNPIARAPSGLESAAPIRVPLRSTHR